MPESGILKDLVLRRQERGTGFALTKALRDDIALVCFNSKTSRTQNLRGLAPFRQDKSNLGTWSNGMCPFDIKRDLTCPGCLRCI
jgi:hypothetical protein